METFVCLQIIRLDISWILIVRNQRGIYVIIQVKRQVMVLYQLCQRTRIMTVHLTKLSGMYKITKYSETLAAEDNESWAVNLKPRYTLLYRTTNVL